MLPSSSSHWSLLIGLTIYTEEQQDIHNMAAILALAQARMMFYMEAVDTAEKLGAGTNKNKDAFKKGVQRCGSADEEVIRLTVTLISKLTHGPTQNDLDNLTVEAYKLLDDLLSKKIPVGPDLEVIIEKRLRDEDVNRGGKRPRQ